MREEFLVRVQYGLGDRNERLQPLTDAQLIPIAEFADEDTGLEDQGFAARKAIEGPDLEYGQGDGLALWESARW